MTRKISRCPICRQKLEKIGRRKICRVCGVVVVGDTFRQPPLDSRSFRPKN